MRGVTRVAAIAGDIADPDHRRQLATAARLLGPVRLVVPRAHEVAHDLGIEQISQERIVEAEEWLEERGYLAPLNVGLTWGTYTITSAGLEWLRGGMPRPLEAPQKAREPTSDPLSASGGVYARAASERVSWWRRLFGGTG